MTDTARLDQAETVPLHDSVPPGATEPMPAQPNPTPPSWSSTPPPSGQGAASRRRP